MTTLPAAHPAFEAIREVTIPSLDIQVAEYRHKKTGAVHYHLAANNTENVFLVALRTMPMDSTGVAHILEHTALCGSQKYPVRDPFFLMIRRSLNTFMNAFTSSDWTAYPFATQNKKDFDNLLSVYLDAVFFANLNPLDFAQEGIRVEFENPEDKTSPLVYKGVVFNEMKGAMSSAHAELWEAINSNLFSSTTYHYNSGGDPAVIPDLKYEDLVAFYKEHYHPSNAVFMTFGDIPAVELQAKFEEQALKSFSALPHKIEGHDENRFTEPKRVEMTYALDEEDASQKTHLVLTWLLGKTANLKDRFETEILSGVLLENSASPLRQFLETTDIALAPSPYCGTDDSSRELSFMCGVEGSEPEHAEVFEKGVLSVLEEVVKNGVPQEDVEAVLHQLELSNREIRGNGYPYGMSLILNGLGAVLHNGDPVSLWDMESVLVELREAIKNPEFVPSLIKKWLLDNPHCVRVTLKPDTNLSAQRIQTEKDRLAAMHRALSPEEADKIIQETKALQQRQSQKDDPEILPKVDREDIPADIEIAQGHRKNIDIGLRNVPLTTYAQGTNGLFYQKSVINLPDLTEEERTLLPVYMYLLTSVGAGKHDYLGMQKWQSSVAGGLSMGLSIRSDLSDRNKGAAHLLFAGKALNNRAEPFNALMRHTLENVRFDEHDRIRELIAKSRVRAEAAVTGNGHSYAMQMASASFSAVADFSYRIFGLSYIRSLKILDEKIIGDEALESMLATLRTMHDKVLSSPQHFLIVGEGGQLPALEKSLSQEWQTAVTKEAATSYQFGRTVTQQQLACLTNTQVQFCARGFAAVPVDHDDAAALTLLGGFLKNGYLHGAIREKGGAYGGGANYDTESSSFRFYSYRDPRLAETLQDFDHSVQWLLNEKHEQRQLEEALFGVISSMDKPLSPAGEADNAFFNELYGRTPAFRRRHREKLLSVTLDDLRTVGERYLTKDSVTAVIAPPSREQDVKALGLDVERL